MKNNLILEGDRTFSITLRKIIEQYTKWNSALFVTYVDFEKVFNSIHRGSLWSIMKFYGIQNKLIKMVKVLYESLKYTFLKDGEESDLYQVHVTTGVKHGYSMYVFLYLIVIDFIMKRTTDGEPPGIRGNFILQTTLLYFPIYS